MLNIVRGKPRKVTKSRAELLKPNSPLFALRLCARMELQTRLPSPETKLRTDQKMPLRHNFTLQGMLASTAAVNGKDALPALLRPVTMNSNRRQASVLR